MIAVSRARNAISSNTNPNQIIPASSLQYSLMQEVAVRTLNDSVLDVEDIYRFNQ